MLQSDLFADVFEKEPLPDDSFSGPAEEEEDEWGLSAEERLKDMLHEEPTSGDDGGKGDDYE